MKQQLEEYLTEALYPLPSCCHCQYSDLDCKRIPCDKCDGWDKYKLHKGHKEDVKRLVRGVMRIVKQQSK